MHERVTSLAAGRRHSVCSRSDGSVRAVGNGAAGECDVLGWADIIAVAAGNVHTATNTGRSHTVGLRSDGTVLATGWDGDGQCQVVAWRQVPTIAAPAGDAPADSVRMAPRWRSGGPRTAVRGRHWREVVSPD